MVDLHIEPTVYDPSIETIAPPPSTFVMLDLETWGTGNKALPISIGACRFDRDQIIDKFHVAIDPVSAQAHGLDIDAGTILWWFDPERREALDRWLRTEKVDIGSALTGFAEWCASSPPLAIYGNGSTFDNIILRSAYEATGLDYPVRFWQDLCYRTLKMGSTTAMVREGTHHDALDDAISQAKHLQAIWRSQDPSAYRTMLQKAAEQFEFYAENHRTKGTPEADAKAIVNAEFARNIHRVLNGEQPIIDTHIGAVRTEAVQALHDAVEKP
jgi:hypothetical protein